MLVETILGPGATVAAAHSHPYQAETFHIRDGRVGFKVGGEKVELRAGDGVTVLPRTAHKFWNAGDGQVLHFLQRAALALGAPVGKALGYGETHEPAVA